ncbi:MAG: DUF5996 family protein [Thermomicrobiales bacterium]
MAMTITAPTTETWPPLPLEAWRETQETLHLWTQVVGKIKLELTPFLNEWWNVAFAVTPRGLTTGAIPAGDKMFAIDFDFVDHTLFVHASDGRTRSLPLIPRSVADFYAELLATVRAMGIVVAINPLPVEIPNPISCAIDTEHASYDPEPVQRWWRILVQTERILQRFRSPFVGKSSPVNFFWGSFDLTATRFSGRPAIPPAGAPRFVQLAEEQENFACGFWPGNPTMSGVALGEPAFFAYIYPEPPGFREAPVRPEAAYHDPDLGLFLLRYDDARRAASPAAAILDFFQSAYEAAATLADWDRRALERIPPKGAVR